MDEDRFRVPVRGPEWVRATRPSSEGAGGGGGSGKLGLGGFVPVGRESRRAVSVCVCTLSLALFSPVTEGLGSHLNAKSLLSLNGLFPVTDDSGHRWVPGHGGPGAPGGRTEDPVASQSVSSAQPQGLGQEKRHGDGTLGGPARRGRGDARPSSAKVGGPPSPS